MTSSDDPTSDLWMQQLGLLRQRVEEFASEASNQGGISCANGCSSCCHVDLAVTAIEAVCIQRAVERLPEDTREGLQQRASALAKSRDSSDPLPCVMLDENGSCTIYADRPMICRTQGLALRYPIDFVPEESLSARASDGSALCWCPLCYTESKPNRTAILDAVKIDELLGIIDQGYRSGLADDPAPRTLLRHLVVSKR